MDVFRGALRRSVDSQVPARDVSGADSRKTIECTTNMKPPAANSKQNISEYIK
jgi:hypothetical protein